MRFAFHLALFLSYAFASVAQDSFDFGGPSPAYDIPENIPLEVQITQALSLTIRDAALQYTFQTEFDKLKGVISKDIEGKNVGSLLKVQIYNNEGGAFEIPGGQLVVPIGTGLNPIDALAEYLRGDNLKSVPPQGLKNDSFYVWIRNSRNGHLTIASIPPEWREGFERIASDERDRRNLLAEWWNSAPEGLRMLQRSKYWQDVAQNRLKDIASNEKKEALRKLMQQFDAAQAAFNQTYIRYQETVAQLAHQQEFLRMLKILGVFADIAGRAINDGTLAGNGAVVKTDAKPQETIDDKIVITTERITKTRGSYQIQRVQIEGRARSLEILDNKIREQFRNNGIVVPKADPVLILEP